MKRTLALVLLLLSSAVIGQAGSITLAWDPSAGAIGYEVHYGQASGNYTQSVDAKAATSVSLSGLTDGMTYYFAALAYDSANQDSPYSNEVSQLIAPPAQTYTVSASPTTVQRNRPMTVNWTAPAGRPSTDWIGLYAAGTDNMAYLWWVYTNGAPSGTASLQSPSRRGTYEFRYLLEDTFTSVAVSGPITVR